MKYLLLNCDQVFDALTRGPFPSGDASDESVELHLRACHECRQLAEALRPAVALLHEAVDRDEALDLPEYQGTLPVREENHSRERPLMLGLRQITRPATTANRAGRRFDQAVSAVRLMAASLLLLALGVLAYGFAIAPERGLPATSIRGLFGDGRQTHLPDGSGILRLASLKLPSQCVPMSYQALSADQAAALAAAMSLGTKEALRCCTECHAALRPRQSQANLVAVAAAQSCSACHRG